MRSRAVTAAHEDRILDALKAAPKDGLSGVELAKATGLWSEPLYGALARIEHDDRVRTLITSRTPADFTDSGNTPMISTTAVDHLMQLGRRRGGLHIDHIRQVLPVDTMTIEELADGRGSPGGSRYRIRD